MRFLVGLVALLLMCATLRAQTLNPNATVFPLASGVDFSDLVPAPAGQNGFLTTRNGRFEWENGGRAKFWGINVAGATIFESDDRIEAMLRLFRRSGFNLVRLHHFDERGGIYNLDAPTSDVFAPERLKKLDFWIHKARENGLYVALSLLDYRRFKSGDGVLNAEQIGRGAKPYAVFDRRLIELQKQSAKQLLRDHKNAFNGLAWADDPTLALVEIFNENGLFIRRGELRRLHEPYAGELKKRWNDWLRQKYASTEALRAAWNGLETGESLENASVELPALTWETARLSASDAAFAGLERRSDGARFAAQIHRAFFAEMKAFLRSEVGVKVPIAASGRFDDGAETWAQAQELDYIAPSFYYDHPYWASGRPQWQLPSFFHGRNPLGDTSFRSLAAQIGLSRVRDKPLVVREWNYAWPNPHRGAGILEAATLACLQDVDAFIAFTYESGQAAKVGYFSLRSDPSRWGVMPIAARMFYRQMIAPLQKRVVFAWSDAETFRYDAYHHPLTQLAWTARVENVFAEPGSVTGADAVFGRSALHAGAAAQKSELLKQIGSTASANADVFFSEDRRVIRNSPGERLVVVAPEVQILAGNLNNVRGTRSGLGVSNLVSGALVAMSLDGSPLVKSSHFLVKMTGNAQNSAQVVRRDPRFASRPDGQWMLETWGQSPVVFGALPQPVEISLAGTPLVRVWGVGEWELEKVNGRLLFRSTPGVQHELLNAKAAP